MQGCQKEIVLRNTGSDSLNIDPVLPNFQFN